MTIGMMQTMKIGKPAWQGMLEYVSQLHKKSTHPARDPFPYDWEEIGPGYCYGPGFGHWDIVHAILDALIENPEHAKLQILNNLSLQLPDGLVPGCVYFRDGKPWYETKSGHPTLWHIAVEDYVEKTQDSELLKTSYLPLQKLVGWYEVNRSADKQGFYYTDILNHKWESGIDEGIRFVKMTTGPFACVDATAHVWHLYETLAEWSKKVGKDGAVYQTKADMLKSFIQKELFNDYTGFFHDIWLVKQKNPPMAFEGMWPMVLGAATREQAMRVIDENLLNPKRYFTPHPISTVGVEDPAFELRMWRGPAWNSMTYWAARGCLRYEREDAAKLLLEKALDQSARVFEQTGTVWEFYHPMGGNPEDIQRKPHSDFNKPCRDYLGHNPLLAMAALWENIQS